MARISRVSVQSRLFSIAFAVTFVAAALAPLASAADLGSAPPAAVGLPGVPSVAEIQAQLDAARATRAAILARDPGAPPGSALDSIPSLDGARAPAVPHARTLPPVSPPPAAVEKSAPQLSLLAAAPDTFQEALVEVYSAEQTATRYVVGLSKIPESLAPGDTLNGDSVVTVNRALGFVVLETTGDITMSRMSAHSLPDFEYEEADPEVAWIQLVPDDALYAEQYAPREVGLETAWATAVGDADAAICVIDTGARLSHVDIDETRFLGGFDAIDGVSIEDGNGHGTHVLGIAAAALNNATGIAGAGNVSFYVARALDSGGFGTPSEVASAIQWCADRPDANLVISMSLGMAVGARSLRNAVEYAHEEGRVVVAAVGNDGPCVNCVSYPARYENVIGVGCTNWLSEICWFSSTGPDVDIVAPGEAILSTFIYSDQSYEVLDGTSMSTPLVAGALALAWSNAPTLTADQIRARLLDGAVDLGDAGVDDLSGHGRLDASCLLAGVAPCDDRIAPVLRSAFFQIDQPGALLLEWSEALDPASVGDGSAFSVLAGETPIAVSGASVDGNLVLVDLAAPVALGVDVFVSYAPGALADPAGNLALGFADATVDTSALPTPGDETGGPDAFGYTFASSLADDGPAFSWTDDSGAATLLSLDDDDISAPIELPFGFSFYGQTRTWVVVSSNGFLTFDADADDGCCGGEEIPSDDWLNGIIAGHWMDIDPSAGGEVRYATVGEPGSRVFVVTWENVPAYWTGEPQSFQIKLFEADHSIEFHYLQAEVNVDDHESTIGIEDATGLVGLAYRGEAVFYFEERAVRFESTVDQIVADFSLPDTALQGETISLTDLSTGASSWAWDFGDTTTSTQRHPTHTFSLPGLYDVTLTVTDAEENTGSVTRQILVTPLDALPAGLFAQSVAQTPEGTFVLGGHHVNVLVGLFPDGVDHERLILEFDPATGQLRWTGDLLPEERAYATAAWGGDAVYLFGGLTAWGGYTDTIFRYHPMSGEVAELTATLPLPMYGLSSVYVPTITPDCPAGCIYLFGGAWDDDGADVDSPLIWRFDPMTGEIVQMAATLPWGTWGNHAALVGGEVYILGGDDLGSGFTGFEPTSGIARYDPATDTITTMDATLPGARTYGAVATDGSSIVVIGGLGRDYESTQTGFSYDPATDTLRPLADTLSEPLAYVTAFWNGTEVVVVGGYGDEGNVNNVQVIDPSALGTFAGPVLALEPGDVDGDGNPGNAATTLITDLSGNNNHATPNGGVSFVGDGTTTPFAFSFDGVDDHLYTATSLDSPSDMTLSVAFRTSASDQGVLSFQSEQLIASTTTTTLVAGPEQFLGIDADGGIVFTGAWGTVVAEGDFADGEWHLVEIDVGPFNSPTGMQLFVDGLLHDRTPTLWTDTWSGYWRVGHADGTGAANAFFTGEIGDVTVWHRAFQNSEVDPALYGAVILPGTPTTIDLRSTEILDPASPLTANLLTATSNGLPLTVTTLVFDGRHLSVGLAAPAPEDADIVLSYVGPTGGLRDMQGDLAQALDVPVLNLAFEPTTEVGLPDAGGYTFLSNVAPGGAPFSFTDISQTGEPVLQAETGSWAVPIGFPFTFYGNEHANVHLSPDGALSFGKELVTGDICDGEPEFAGVRAAWTPFVLGMNDLRYETVGAPGSRSFIAQWTNAVEYGEGPLSTFQIRLNEADGTIAVAYKELSLLWGDALSECPATAGLSGPGGKTVLHYRSAITDLTGVQVVYAPPATSPLSLALSQTDPLVGEEIGFSFVGPATPTTVLWSFGDGATSDLAAPMHTYAAPGVFFVDLTVTAGEDTFRAVRRIEVHEPGIGEHPIQFGNGFAHDGDLYSIPFALLSSYSGLGGPIVRYDVDRDVVIELEAEIPIGSYLAPAVGTPDGAYVIGTIDTSIATFDAVYRFDVGSGMVFSEPNVQAGLLSLLARGAWDPRETEDCPTGCAFLTGGLFSLLEGPRLLRYSPALGETTFLQELAPEQILFGAASIGPAGVFTHGGLDAEGAITDAVTRVDVWGDRADVVGEGGGTRALHDLLWTGERFLMVGGVTDEGTSEFASEIVAFDPYTGESVTLGVFSREHVLGAMAYTGEGVAALGGQSVSGALIDLYSAEFFDIAPQARRIAILGNVITIDYSEPLPESFAPGPSHYDVSINGVATTVTVVNDRPMGLTLELADAAGHGDEVLFSYTPPVVTEILVGDALEPMAISERPIENLAPPTLATTPAAPDGLMGWFSSATTVSITPAEGALYCTGAGCAPITPYTEPVALADGVTVFRARSAVDGVHTNVVEDTFMVDTVAPTATAGGASGVQTTTGATVTFTFSEAMDEASTLAALTGAGTGWTRTFNDADTVLTLVGTGIFGSQTITVGTGARDAHGVHLGQAVSRELTFPAASRPSGTETIISGPGSNQQQQQQQQEEQSPPASAGAAGQDGTGQFAIVLMPKEGESTVTATFDDEELIVDEIAADVGSDGQAAVRVSVKPLDKLPSGIPPLPDNVSPLITFEAKVSHATTGDKAAVQQAVIRFSLTSAQLGGANPSSFVLMHYTGSVWEPLPTSYLGFDIVSGKHQYSAVTPGFSVFALAIDALAPKLSLAFSTPKLSGAWEDSMSGVDPKTLVVALGSRTLSATTSATGFVLDLPTDLAAGLHKVLVKVKDRAGNEAVQEASVEVAPKLTDVTGGATGAPGGTGVTPPGTGGTGTTGSGTAPGETPGEVPGAVVEPTDEVPNAWLLLTLLGVMVAIAIRRRRA